MQNILEKNRNKQTLRTNAKAPSLLTGLLFDQDGHPLSPSHTKRKNRRYRYYVNQAVIQFKQIPPDTVTRIPAQKLEAIVTEELLDLLSNPPKLLEIAVPLNLTATEQQNLKEQAEQLKNGWEKLNAQQQIAHLAAMIRKVSLSRTAMTIEYSISGIVNQLLEHANYQEELLYSKEIPLSLKRCGVETKLVVENQTNQKLQPHADTVRAIQEAVQKGMLWNQLLISGKAESVKEIANANQVGDRYVSRIIKLAFLSPKLIRQIFKGEIPHDLTLRKLKANTALKWSEQEALFA